MEPLVMIPFDPGDGPGGVIGSGLNIIDILLWVMLLLMLLLLLWLLLSLFRRNAKDKRISAIRSEEDIAAAQARGDIEAYEAERLRRLEEERRREAQRQLEERTERLEQAMQAQPALGRVLKSMAGKGVGETQDVSASREAAENLARRLSDSDVMVLWLSAMQTDINMDLARRLRREQVSYATSDAEPDTLRDLSEISRVLPEDLVLPPEIFYQRAASGELRTITFHETHEIRKRLYILLDVSGSMGDKMPRSRTVRHVWARGVVASLLFKALEGKADYLLRTFTSTPQQLRTVESVEQARTLLDYILQYAHTDGGTNIAAALWQAAADLQSIATPDSPADILLITDGHDETLRMDFVRRLLGDTMRLHVVLIGNDHPGFKQVAASYRSFV